jgi:hypothetical protein
MQLQDQSVWELVQHKFVGLHCSHLPLLVGWLLAWLLRLLFAALGCSGPCCMRLRPPPCNVTTEQA